MFTTRFLRSASSTKNCAYNAIPYETIECPEHLALSEEAARRSVVLLKNDGLLPLNSKIRTIGVIGPNANDRMALIGNYHGTASRYIITVLEGIQDYVGDRARVLYAEGCHNMHRDAWKDYLARRPPRRGADRRGAQRRRRARRRPE